MTNQVQQDQIRAALREHDVVLSLRELNQLILSKSPLLPVWAGSRSRLNALGDSFPPHVYGEAKAGPKAKAKLFSLSAVLDWLDGLETEAHKPLAWRAVAVWALNRLGEDDASDSPMGFRRQHTRAAITLGLLVALGVKTDPELDLDSAIDEGNLLTADATAGGAFVYLRRKVSLSAKEEQALVLSVLRMLPKSELFFLFHWAMGQIPSNLHPQTPRAVTKFARELVSLSVENGTEPEAILDPAAGTGSLLLEATKPLGAAKLSACESDEGMASLAVMAWLLDAREPAQALNVLVGDSFEHSENGLTYDLVVCDPPQGALGYKSPCDWLERSLASVNPDGHALVVLPTVLLERSGGHSATVIASLIEAGRIEAIILMPSSVKRATEKTGSAIWLLRGSHSTGEQSGRVLLVDASHPDGFTDDRRAPEFLTERNAAWTEHAIGSLAAFRSGGVVEPWAVAGVSATSVSTSEVLTQTEDGPVIDLFPPNYLDSAIPQDQFHAAQGAVENADADIRKAQEAAASFQESPREPDWSSVSAAELKSLTLFDHLIITTARRAAGDHPVTSVGDVLVTIGRDGRISIEIDSTGGQLLVLPVERGPRGSMLSAAKVVFSIRIDDAPRLHTDTEGHFTPELIAFFLNSAENERRQVEALSSSESVGRLRLPVLTEQDALQLDGYLKWLQSATDRALELQKTASSVRGAVEILSSNRTNNKDNTEQGRS